MQIEINRLKNAVKDIKEGWDSPNDSHTKAEYNGMCEGLDMLLKHFKEIKMPELNYVGSGKHKQLGFEWEGFFITDPFTSSCNRFEVDPISEYGLTTEQVKRLKQENNLGD